MLNPNSAARRLSFVLPLSALALILGCARTSDEDALISAKGAALHQANSCPDLLAQIQADATAKLDLSLAQAKKDYAAGLRGGGVVGVDAGASTGGTTSSSDGDLSMDGGASDPIPPTVGEGDSGSKAPDEHSETTTQVKGVDEADIVKTDGERIYLLHGNDLFLFDSWPADETHMLGSAKVSGQALELFVEGGKAVVFSSFVPSDLPPREGASVKPGYECYDCYSQGFTEIAVYDVAGDAPVLERELLLEGSYVSARRHGSDVRAIVQGGFYGTDLYYPDVSAYDSFGRGKSQEAIDAELSQWRDRIAGEISTTTLDDWIPRRYERGNGVWQELPTECESYFVPEPGRTPGGVTEVATFDIEKPDSDPHVVAVLGSASTVYANQGALLLGQTDYGWGFGALDHTQTLLHRFAIAEDETAYEASGFVPGYLVNQFAVDEQDGIVRVSTTNQIVTDKDTWSMVTENRVYTLDKKGHELEQLGKTEPLGEAGETIQATRFIGDRGYVVTYLQTDPLIVVDLADPARPRVTGELHIPGFSTYVEPLPNHHLLAVGQGENGGVSLSIFDASSPNQDPKRVQYHEFSSSYSEAMFNQKALTFMLDKFGADESLLLFPITTYESDYSSRLEVMQVSVSDGFKSLGSIDHTDLLRNGCLVLSQYDDAYYCDYGGTDMRRGVEIGQSDGADYIYAISYGGVTVHDLAKLDTALATVPLPAPDFGYSYYPGSSVDAPSTGGSAGVEDAGDGSAGGAPSN